VLRTLLAVVACTAGALVAVLLAEGLPIGEHGFKEMQHRGFGQYVFLTLAASMLLGVFANGAWSYLSEGKGEAAEQRLSVGNLFRATLSSRSFLKSILVSPIVFAAVYAVAKDQPDPVVGHLLAFENGFFWNAVLDARRPGLTLTPPK